MTDNEKALLENRLGDCILRLEKAQEYLAEGAFLEASVFVATVLDSLPRLRMKLQLNQ